VSVLRIGHLTVRQLNLFAHKVALALYFEHFRKPLSSLGRVCACWRSSEDFARGGIPQRLLEIMPQYQTLQQGRWNERETFEFRFDTSPKDGLFCCLARFRGRVLTLGLVVQDEKVLPSDQTDWIAPNDPDVLLNSPRFQRKYFGNEP
jgi:hypothetical protein